MAEANGAAPDGGAIRTRYEPDDAGCTVSVLDGERAVAVLRVIRLTMCLRGAFVPMAGIGDVRTHPAHRRQGHARRLFAATLEHMRRERYAVSLLFGISDFYWRFGYTPVLPEYDASLSTRDAERLVASRPAAAAVAVRPGRPEDGPALLDLYTRANAARSGTLRRTAEAFDTRPKPDVQNWWFHPRRYLVAEQDGAPQGYAALSGDPSSLRVREIVVPEAHVAGAGTALIGALTEEALARRLERIRLPLPPDEPLMGLLRPVGCKLEVTYPSNASGMGRIVDLAVLAEALTPELAGRAAALPDATRPGALELAATAVADGAAGAGPEQRATLRWGDGPALAVTLPQPALCQLLHGYRGIDELRIDHPDAVDAAAVDAVRALLPAGYPHMWSPDHF
jgi:predicted N-acetyltransferase YhbS